MLQLRRISLCLFTCLVGLVNFSNAQVPGLDCPPFTIDDLGSTTVFSSEGLLAKSLDPGAETPVIVPVLVMDFRTVCEATGLMRDTASFVSVVVRFQCDFQSNLANLEDCDGTTVLTRQYQYFCNQQNIYQIRDPSFVQTLQPTANFETPLDTSCIRCINDQANPGSSLIDSNTHCEMCPPRCLNRGLGRCYRAATTDPCCSYYNDSRCVEDCPSPLVGNNVTFNCECGRLTIPNNGLISYSNDFAIDSVATQTCTDGYRVVGGGSRTCTFGGWDGQDFTCDFVECPALTIANGMVTYSTVTPVLGTEAMYTCNEGYGLKGVETRTCQRDETWSGSEPSCEENCGGCGPGTCNLVTNRCECPPGYRGEGCSEKCTLVELDPNCVGCTFDVNGNEICICKDGAEADAEGKCPGEGDTGESSSSCSPGCIAGIVLAILGAIIMAIVVALVVYAVYSYLSNPATKLAKAGTEGLNGVARDNPLYLPPEDIVEDVDKVGDVEVA